MSNDKKPVDKFVLRIESDLKKQVEQKAKDTERSLNSHIIMLLKQDLEKK